MGRFQKAIPIILTLTLGACTFHHPSAPISLKGELPDMPPPFTAWRSLPAPQLVWNGAVQAKFQFYLRENKRELEASLERLAEYLPGLLPIFERYALPPELLYLGVVESAFRPEVKSRAGATGIWQLMKPIAAEYGLKVGLFVDERKDPLKSTEAVAQILLDLYREFDDWYLALAAYNAGKFRIARVIRETGAKDFWSLCETGRLRAETEQFVPKFIAVALILEEGERYGLRDLLDERIANRTGN